MKYVSKQQSLSLILRSGIPANKIAGTQPVPGIHLRFEHSRADTKSLEKLKVSEEEAIEMVERHCSYNVSFFREESAPVMNSVVDPIPGQRHSITNLENGKFVQGNKEKKEVKFSDEQKAFMREFLDNEVEKRVETRLKENEETKKEVSKPKTKKTTKKTSKK